MGAASLGVLVALTTAPAQADALRDKWCSNVKIRFFVGGAEGDAFGTIVYNGAVQAAHDTGAQVEYVFSGWDQAKMVQQLREAVAAHPDGIAMMGHPSDNAIMPLAEQAAKAGIKMEYQNVDVPQVRAKFGGGYVGAQLEPQGRALGEEAIRRFDLKAGDTVIVAANFDDSNRAVREASTAKAFEDAGLKVIQLNSPPEWAADLDRLGAERPALRLLLRADIAAAIRRHHLRHRHVLIHHPDPGLGGLLGERHDRVVSGMSHHGDAIGLRGHGLAQLLHHLLDVP
ncbi:MAG: substrate-binding domain-containing protein, partial [Devosia sp.]